MGNKQAPCVHPNKGFHDPQTTIELHGIEV